MKCFLKGVLGAAIGFIALTVCTAQYADYRAAAEVSGWLLALAPVQDAIAATATKQGGFAGVSKDVKKPAFPEPNVSVFKVSDAGEITVKGGKDGQMLVLSPTLVNGKTVWDCVGSPNKAVPFSCRK